MNETQTNRIDELTNILAYTVIEKCDCNSEYYQYVEDITWNLIDDCISDFIIKVKLWRK